MWKYDHLDDLQLGLLERGIIDIGGEINSETGAYVRDALLRLIKKGSPDITVFITSAGGSVSVALSIYDALTLYKGKKTGIVMGFARSMAVIILQACDKRLAARHSEILIHHISHSKEVSLDMLRDKRKMDRIYKDLEENQELIYKILSSHTGRAIIEIRTECRKEKGMSAEKAFAFGLIDEIIEKPLESV
ncbi:MAG: ATP-dependent Clp protease proteolytic subunit [Candidatus Jorgensenbacteria bacterium]|nr:ATP-dependent Clp protease proteolytic subunit [Candidatus Jorgensenbacteria bacterium]